MAKIENVLVTGATGFVGAHVLDELLRRGIKVRAAARSRSKAEQMLKDRPQYKSQLDFVFIDEFTTPGVFDNAIKDVDAIVHAASPVYYDIKDNEQELILPALNGTKSILEAAKTESRVKRIVFISSFAAVIDPWKDWRPGYTYTAVDWNPITYEQGKTGDPVSGYRVGKKFAELAAWTYIAQERPQFDLVTFCPPMVFGPVVHPVLRTADLNDSNAQLWSITDKSKPILRPRGPSWVDVRDLAYASVEALVREEVGNRRYTIAAPGHFTYQLAADIARQELEWAKDVVNKGNEAEPLPDAYLVDGTTAAKDLGVTYRTFRESVLESLSQFRDIQLRE